MLSTFSLAVCRAAKIGKHGEKGWPSSAYGVSKMCVTQMTEIQQKEMDADPRNDIVINSVSCDSLLINGHFTLLFDGIRKSA